MSKDERVNDFLRKTLELLEDVPFEENEELKKLKNKIDLIYELECHTENKEFHNCMEWAFGKHIESSNDVPRIWKEKHSDLPNLMWYESDDPSVCTINMSKAIFMATKYYVLSKENKGIS